VEEETMVAVAWAVPSLMGPLVQKQVVERSWVVERVIRRKRSIAIRRGRRKCSIRWLSNRSRQCSRNGSGGNIGGDI
jgi:hypothetical protein